VYDIQDESTRNSGPRPFAFRELMDPSWYASLFRAESGKDCLVYKCCPTSDSVEHFEAWLDQSVSLHGHCAYNLVGAASSLPVGETHPGPSVEEAASLLHRSNEDSSASKPSVHFGCVAIAERHLAKNREHENMVRKIGWGAEWFVSQGIFDTEATIALLNDYGALCKARGIVPKKVLLTFVPCGRTKTMDFIRWLGMNVPADVEARIFSASSSSSTTTAAAAATMDKVTKTTASPPSTPVQESCKLAQENLTKILESTAGCGVPLGLNVESVSGYRDEIDATHDLFSTLQALMLDHRGSPWMVRWYDVPSVMGGKEDSVLQRKLNELNYLKEMLQHNMRSKVGAGDDDDKGVVSASTGGTAHDSLLFLMAGAVLFGSGVIAGVNISRGKM